MAKGRDDLELVARAAGFAMACEDNAPQAAQSAVERVREADRARAIAKQEETQAGVVAQAKSYLNWTPGWTPWKTA